MGTRFIAMRSPKSGIPGCGRILRDQGHAERFEPLLENVDDGSLRVVCGYWPRAGAKSCSPSARASRAWVFSALTSALAPLNRRVREVSEPRIEAAAERCRARDQKRPLLGGRPPDPGKVIGKAVRVFRCE